MSPYELKKIQVEYKRVNAAREEQELRILEMQDQIDKIQKSVDVSLAKEQELLARISEAQSSN